MMSFLRNILLGTARPAAQRPVPMVPMAKNPARTEAVEVLELRIKEAMPLRPAAVMQEDAPSPAPRPLLMAASRAAESKVAQLERELVMERLRVKELREQLDALRVRGSVMLGAVEKASAVEGRVG